MIRCPSAARSMRRSPRLFCSGRKSPHAESRHRADVVAGAEALADTGDDTAEASADAHALLSYVRRLLSCRGCDEPLHVGCAEVLTGLMSIVARAVKDQVLAR